MWRVSEGSQSAGIGSPDGPELIVDLASVLMRGLLTRQHYSHP